MLATLIQTLANADPAYAARRVRRAVIDFAIAGICLAIGLGFLLAGCFIIAMERYGAVATTFGFGVGFILLAVIALIVHRIVSQMSARRRAAKARAAQVKTLAGATALAVLPSLLRGRGGMLEAMLPVIAMVAYAIYKENSGAPGDDGETPDG